jgi:hypothetical protein
MAMSTTFLKNNVVFDGNAMVYGGQAKSAGAPFLGGGAAFGFQGTPGSTAQFLVVVMSTRDITYSCPAGKWMQPSGTIKNDFVGCAYDCMPGTYGVMLAGIEHISLALTL